MKYIGLAFAIVLSSIAVTGCQHNLTPGKGTGVKGKGLGRGGLLGGGGLLGDLGHRYREGHVPRLPRGAYHETGPAGPPTGSYAYPYYTNRSPRDFLDPNPPTIGY